MAERRARLGAPRYSPLPSLSEWTPKAYRVLCSSCMHRAADTLLGIDELHAQRTACARERA